MKAFQTWEKIDSAFNPPVPATMRPMILIVLGILAIQAISNLITDWNTDPNELVSDEEQDIEQLKKQFLEDATQPEAKG